MTEHATPPVGDARVTPLPCPFCGHPAIRMVDLSTNPKTHSYRCDNDDCDVRPTTCQKTQARVALNLWNTRALSRATGEEATVDEDTVYIALLGTVGDELLHHILADLKSAGLRITRAATPGAEG